MKVISSLVGTPAQIPTVSIYPSNPLVAAVSLTIRPNSKVESVLGFNVSNPELTNTPLV